MKTLLVMVVTIFSFSSFAGTQADLILKGNVSPVLNISVTPETVATNLDLSQGVTNLKVATITEQSNHASGYKIRARSLNAGKLINVDDHNSFVNYNLSYNGDNIPLAPANVPIYSTTNKGTFTKDVKITYNQPSHLSAGVYQDTVQFTIEAN